MWHYVQKFDAHQMLKKKHPHPSRIQYAHLCKRIHILGPDLCVQWRWVRVVHQELALVPIPGGALQVEGCNNTIQCRSGAAQPHTWATTIHVLDLHMQMASYQHDSYMYETQFRTCCAVEVINMTPVWFCKSR